MDTPMLPIIRPGSTRAWLDRFIDAATLNETSAFRVVAATDLTLDRRVVVAAPAEGVDRAASTAALGRLFYAHREPSHLGIARAGDGADD